MSISSSSDDAEVVAADILSFLGSGSSCCSAGGSEGEDWAGGWASSSMVRNR